MVTQTAVAWLANYLSENGGTAPSAQIKAAGQLAGHSAMSLKRARAALRYRIRSEQFPRRTYWTDATAAVTPSHPVGPRTAEHDWADLSTGAEEAYRAAVALQRSRNAETESPAPPRASRAW